MFDRIVMNPPFAQGADIRHIEHARGKFKPGGRLVAICAAGPRQRERSEAIAAEWIDLPAGSFKEQWTSVNSAIVVIDAEPAIHAVGKNEASQPVRNLGYSHFESARFFDGTVRHPLPSVDDAS